MDTLCENYNPGKSIVEELTPKNVRFRDKEEEVGNGMMIDSPSGQPATWREKLLWIMAFDPSQAYPSVVMAWIRFSALPSYLYNHKIITEIGELVGKVVKLDLNTDSRTRGYFARLAVYVNLETPLVS
ncbi:hypothetical protein GOBAR_AA37232 [Gossypium barbadense]|uniref:Uncharacterized protein n=1 Tax=Gossypium barbadense TaxID=3634 RepID=A0A2P5VXB8_GOSBA|nr:hypothetical protein GOBAR_AA37232 [Gossypium barbadense]